jgi:hypothetical protein
MMAFGAPACFGVAGWGFRKDRGVKSKTGRYKLRLPLSLKAAVEKLAKTGWHRRQSVCRRGGGGKAVGDGDGGRVRPAAGAGGYGRV